MAENVLFNHESSVIILFARISGESSATVLAELRQAFRALESNN